jgi:hypothetical protein
MLRIALLEDDRKISMTYVSFSALFLLVKLIRIHYLVGKAAPKVGDTMARLRFAAVSIVSRGGIRTASVRRGAY